MEPDVSDYAHSVPAASATVVDDKPLVLFDSDKDGYGAASVMYKYFGREGAVYLPQKHGGNSEGPPDEVLEADPTYVLLCDYSWPVDQLVEVTKLGHNVCVIDHHKSFVSELGVSPELTEDTSYVSTQVELEGGVEIRVVYGPNKSAATLAWHTMYGPKRPPSLLRHIEDRDLWNWELECSDEILLALDVAMDQLEDPVDKVELIRDNWGAQGLAARGDVLVSYRDMLVQRFARHTRLAHYYAPDGQTYTAAVANAPELRSKVGHYILDEYPDADIAVMYSVGFSEDEDTEVYVSLRSRDGGVDVSQIATHYGGGGHPSAAGFKALGCVWPELHLIPDEA